MSMSKDKRSNFVEVTNFFSGGENSRRKMLARPEGYIYTCWCVCYCTLGCDDEPYVYHASSGYIVSLNTINPGSTGPYFA